MSLSRALRSALVLAVAAVSATAASVACTTGRAHAQESQPTEVIIAHPKPDPNAPPPAPPPPPPKPAPKPTPPAPRPVANPPNVPVPTPGTAPGPGPAPPPAPSPTKPVAPPPSPEDKVRGDHPSDGPPVIQATSVDEPKGPDGRGSDKPSGHFTVSFLGGAIVPEGSFKDAAKTGLDVGARLGYTAGNGLGFTVNLEYAPLRNKATPPLEVSSHLGSVIFAPRVTLGSGAASLWVSAGGGVILERKAITDDVTALTSTEFVKTAAFEGSAGIDLAFFANGGLELVGAYTHSVGNTASPYSYVTLSAGLVFLLK